MADQQMQHLNISENRPRKSRAKPSLSVTLRSKLEAVAHAAGCRATRCEHLNCGMAKKLLDHLVVCRRGPGRCYSFDRTWRCLQVHTKTCKQSNCNCRGLPDRLMKLRQRHESQRMLRQQVERLEGLQLQQPAEDAGTS